MARRSAATRRSSATSHGAHVSRSAGSGLLSGGAQRTAAAIRASSSRWPSPAATLVGLAGSVTTVAGIAMGLPTYDPARIHHARISAADVHEVTRRLLAQTRAARAAIAVMHPGRVDVIGGGSLILDRIMQRFGCSAVLVSEHDILDGIAWSLAVGARR